MALLYVQIAYSIKGMIINAFIAAQIYIKREDDASIRLLTTDDLIKNANSETPIKNDGVIVNTLLWLILVFESSE